MPAESPAQEVASTPAAEPREHSWARYVVFGVSAAAILYLELKPEPSLNGTPFVPAWLMQFCDQHDFLNNVLGFGALTAVAHFTFAGWRREPGRRVLRRAAAIAAGIVALELVQLALPERSCDWHDVAAGWLGVLVASAPWLRGSRPSFES
jgi:hypothetical protein